MIDLSARSGLAIGLQLPDLSLVFGEGMVHPPGERRRLDDVRAMLREPESIGPDVLYSVYMGVEDHAALTGQGLLYGAMAYNSGAVGQERLRSQGHLHTVQPGTGLRYSEVFEFWTGEGYLYLQKEAAPDVTRAMLVRVGPGDKVVLPSGWAHLVVTLGDEAVSFGAWCARDNDFEYTQLQALGGPAYFVLANGEVARNPRYRSVAALEMVDPGALPDFGIPRSKPIYTSWRENPSLFDFLPNPEFGRSAWEGL